MTPHLNRLGETVQMRGHIICFYAELTKIIHNYRQYFLLSRALCPYMIVSGYIPNCPEAVLAMLAAASLGAVWSSTSPDFGVVVSLKLCCNIRIAKFLHFGLQNMH